MTELALTLIPDGSMELFAFSVLILSSFAASLITAAFGIGGGAMLLAIMATLAPPAALIPTHGAIQVGSNAGRALVMFCHIFWPALPAFTAGSVIGAVFGGSLAITLSPAWVQIGIGSFIIWSVLGRPPRGMHDWQFTIGIFSSFLTMFFGATGPFIATFTRSRNLPRHTHVGTHAALMILQHSIKTITFGLLGFALSE
ncbi:MAG: TSUP family transporter [Paracoccus sp. (in: a-proteobacteria)]